MRRIIAIVAVLALCLSGCHSMIDDGDRELVICASFRPLYALLRGVCEGAPKIRVECLAQPLNGCLRSYELSNWDIAKLSLADAVFIGGRGLESFEDSFQGANFAVVATMTSLQLLGADEQVPEGDDEIGHFTGANPWAWMSVDGARGICESMAAAMIRLDPKYEDVYLKNLEKLNRDFDDLEDYMEKAAPQGDIGVAVMHEGLEYLANDLGLSVAAVIERESGEDMDDKAALEAAQSILAAGASVALIEKQAPTRLIGYLESAGINIVLIDTCAFCDGPDAYLGIMRENAAAVADAVKA